MCQKYTYATVIQKTLVALVPNFPLNQTCLRQVWLTWPLDMETSLSYIMNPVISAALDAICLERDDKKYSVSFKTTAAIVKQFGEQDLANFLFSEIPRKIPFELVAELFDFLAWQTSDNGAAIHRTIEKWLQDGADNRRLLIALNLETYPFTDPMEMEQVLSSLAEKNHRVAARCKYLIHSRRKMA